MFWWYNGIREEVKPLYRTQKLRDLERDLSLTPSGSIEGFYRSRASKGYTRKEIAESLSMSVSALSAWITKWNKAKDQSNDQEVPSS